MVFLDYDSVVGLVTLVGLWFMAWYSIGSISYVWTGF